MKLFKFSCLVAGLLMVTIISTGCMSQYLKKKISEKEKYEETVSSILISEDGKNIVFIGNNYHYILNAPPKIIHSLNSKIHDKLEASFSGFEEFENHGEEAINGHVTIMITRALTEDESIEAIKLGFQHDKDKYVFQETLWGKRYPAKNLIGLPNNYKLNRTYKIEILEDKSKGNKAMLALVSPIAFVGDVVVVTTTIVGVVVLFPITIPLINSGLHRHH